MLNAQSRQPTKLDLIPTNNVWVSIDDFCCLLILDPTSTCDVQFDIILHVWYLIGNPMSPSGTQFNVRDLQVDIILQAWYLFGNPMSSRGTQLNVHDVLSLICIASHCVNKIVLCHFAKFGIALFNTILNEVMLH